MKVIICPGVHSTQFTNRFILSLNIQPEVVGDWLIFPTEKYPPYSSFHLYWWLNKPEILNEELLFICFSAGVVAGIGAAILLQLKGITIKGIVAMDGWGVPLWGNFPIYRLSHDYFTHWTSAILGTGKESFYCDPAVEHLTLWEAPEICQGWIVRQNNNLVKCSAKDYLQSILNC